MFYQVKICVICDICVTMNRGRMHKRNMTTKKKGASDWMRPNLLNKIGGFLP